jgi:hypothetical protein
LDLFSFRLLPMPALPESVFYVEGGEIWESLCGTAQLHSSTGYRELQRTTTVGSLSWRWLLECLAWQNQRTYGRSCMRGEVGSTYSSSADQCRPNRAGSETSSPNPTQSNHSGLTTIRPHCSKLSAHDLGQDAHRTSSPRQEVLRMEGRLISIEEIAEHLWSAITPPTHGSMPSVFPATASVASGVSNRSLWTIG